MLGELVVHLEAETQAFVRPVNQVQAGLGLVSDKANDAIFNLNAMAKGLAGIQTASQGLGAVGNQFSMIAKVSGLAATGANYVASGVGVIGSAAYTAAVGLGMVLKPLAGLGIAAKVATSSVAMLAKMIIAPFKLAASIVYRFASALWAVTKPLLSLVKTFVSVKIAMTSFKVQFQVLRSLLLMLPPHLRIAALGLVGLGAAGRTGAAAMSLFAKAAGLAALAVTNPIAALKLAMLSAAKSAAGLAISATRTSFSLVKLTMTGAASGLMAIGRAALSVSAMLGGSLLGAALALGKALAFIGTAGIGWGGKLASDAEQAQIGFATFLKSGNAARALLTKLEEFAASTPFQLASLRDGAKQLLNAGVVIASVTTRLRMLGDIAAGTGKPIMDFVNIFSKVKNTGKVSLETLNQLAERGVPIYSALAQQLGVGRQEMLKMISDGKVGFAELDAALKSTTTGVGIFAGASAAQAMSMAGLWSTLKDNIGFAFRDLAATLGEAFNFKGMLSNSISFFQAFRSGIDTIRPLLFSLADTARTVFGAIGEVAGVVFGGIQSASGLTFDSIISGIMQAQAHVRFIAKAWPDFFELVWANAKLNAVTAFNVIAHQITEVIPTALSWFADNWRDIFTTIGSFTGSVFTNLATNAMNILKELWDFIASGGTNAMQVAWKPLTEGFKNTVAELPDIPERAITDLEKSLSQDVARISDVVGNAWNAEFDKIGDYGRKTMQDVANDPATQPDQLADPESQAQTDTKTGSQSRQQEEKRVGVLQRGSADAFKAIFAGKDRAMVTEQKTANKHLSKHEKLLKKIADKPSTNFVVQGAV